MLGSLTAQRGERSVTQFRTGKTALLLACLAQDPRRPLRRDDLMERLWPDQSEEVAKNRLRVTLSSLRQLLEPEDADRDRVLLADRQHVRLKPEAVTTDTMEFEECLLRAARARDDGERLLAFEAAVEKYQSDFLPEYEDLWVIAERVRLADAYQVALRGTVKIHVNHRRYERALAVAHTAVRADPYREETHRLVMQIHTLMGRPGAALKQYEQLEGLLKKRTGAAPSRAAQDMGSGANKRPPTVEAPAMEPRRHEANADKKPTAARSPVRIPHPVSRLMGREEAVLRVLQMLDTPETRLINLTGPGGVGKTRLALAAAEQAKDLGWSVWYLPLAGLTDPSEIPVRLGMLLGVALRPRAGLLDRVASALAESTSLLVLDNLEHLMPESAFTVHMLLENTPSLTCLTTSRQRLGVPGEYGYSVRPLELPSPSDNLEQIASCASVRLWLDRVRASAPDFRLTEANCRDVAELCRALDGLPLAIELAAGWAAALSPAEVVSRLAARFDLLVSRDSHVDGRHASLRAAFDWSYDLLAAPARQFLARLSVFRCGCTLEAAEAICCGSQALQLMAELRERSWVTAEETVSGTRYHLLETIREYAASHLVGAELSETRARFCSYFLLVAQREEEALKGPTSAVSINRLNCEDENLRSALALGLSGCEDPNETLSLAVALYRYW